MSLTGYNPATVSTFSSTYRHVALSISGSTHTLYLDGSAVAVNSNAGNIFSIYTSAIQNLYIGCAGDLSYGYTGIIDDFKIWNRALPASDISAIYNANKPITVYSTDFTGDQFNLINAGTYSFDGWTVTLDGAGNITNNLGFFTNNYAMPTQSAYASGTSICMRINGNGVSCKISRSIYLYANYNYILTFFISTRIFIGDTYYYKSDNYFRGTVSDGTSYSIFDISGAIINPEIKKSYSFTVPTSSNYTFLLKSGSDVNISDSTYILRNVNIIGHSNK